LDELTPAPENPLQPFTVPDPPPPAPSRGLRWVFIGDNGIRAGWGILLFVLIFLACGFALSRLMHHFFPHPHFAENAPLPPIFGIIGEALQLLCVAIATGVLALIEHKSIFAYGFKGNARALRFISGLVWGFVAISALVLILWKAHLLAFDGRILHGAAIWKDAALWGLVFLLVGLFEETCTRGYVQYTMARGVGFWWGALVFSFLFGFAHSTNVGESPVGLVSAGGAGLILCISLYYTGSLWWAIGFHAAWDWGQSYFYGTADSGMIAQGHLYNEHPVGKLLWSGGLTGPEGSLIIIPLLIIIALAMRLWWGRRVVSPFADCGWRPAWSRKPRAAHPPTIPQGTIEAAS
jgi:hypothetical protein